MKKMNLALAATVALTFAVRAEESAPTEARTDRVSTPIYGIIRVTGSESATSSAAGPHAGEVVVSTPWTGPEGEPVTVRDLVTNGLRDGDLLFVYDAGKSEKYHAFEWSASANGWTGIRNADDPLQEEAVDPDKCVVRAGVSVWYKRASHTGLFSITGQVREPVETTVAAGEKTLVVNPFWAEADLLEKLEATGAAEGDILVVDKVRYTYETVGDVSGWYKVIPGETSTRTVGGKEITYRKPDTKEKVSSIAVAAGTEIWYDSKGGAPKIVWKTDPAASESKE